MYGSEAWLGAMQTLLLIGLVAAMALTVMAFRKEQPEGRCDIHRCPKQDCRKLHTR